MEQSYATKAIGVFNNALTVLHSSQNKANYELIFESTIQDFLAELYKLKREYYQSEIHFDKSVMAFRDLVQQTGLEYVDDLIAVYNNRGCLKLQTGRNAEAYENFNKCDFIFKQIPEAYNKRQKPSWPLCIII